MKKYILLVAGSLIFASCSDMKAKIADCPNIDTPAVAKAYNDKQPKPVVPHSTDSYYYTYRQTEGKGETGTLITKSILKKGDHTTTTIGDGEDAETIIVEITSDANLLRTSE